MTKQAQKQNRATQVINKGCFGNMGEGLRAQQGWGWISRTAAWRRHCPSKVLKEYSPWYTVDAQIPTNK